MISLEKIGKGFRNNLIIPVTLSALALAGCFQSKEDYFFRIADVNKDGYQDVVAIRKKGLGSSEIYTLYGDKMGICIPETNKEGKRMDIIAWDTESSLIIWLNKEANYLQKRDDFEEYFIKNQEKK